MKNFIYDVYPANTRITFFKGDYDEFLESKRIAEGHDGYLTNWFWAKPQYWDIVNEGFCVASTLRHFIDPTYVPDTFSIIDIPVDGWLACFTNSCSWNRTEWPILNYYEYLDTCLEVDLAADEHTGIQAIDIDSFLSKPSLSLQEPNAMSLGLGVAIRLNNIQSPMRRVTGRLPIDALVIGLRVSGNADYEGLTNPISINVNVPSLREHYNLRDDDGDADRPRYIDFACFRENHDGFYSREDEKASQFLAWWTDPELLEKYFPFDPYNAERVVDAMSTAKIDAWLQKEFGIKWLDPATYTGRIAVYAMNSDEWDFASTYYNSPCTMEDYYKYRDVDIPHIYDLMDRGLF